MSVAFSTFLICCGIAVFSFAMTTIFNIIDFDPSTGKSRRFSKQTKKKK